MNKDLLEEVRKLEGVIKSEERKINQAISKKDFESITKSINTIESNLKYLSIIVNGVPLEPKDNRKIMDFIRIHMENMWKVSVPA